MTRPRLVQLAVVALLTAAAGLAFAPVYASDLYPLVALGAAVGSVGLWALAAWKLPGRDGLGLLVSLGGYLLFVANTVLRDSVLVVVPTPGTVADLADGLVNGWARLMSTALPVADDPSMLLVAPTLVWVAGYVAARVAVHRTAVLAPVVPPVVVLAVGVFYAGPRTGASVGTVALVVGLGLVLLLLRTLRPAGALANVAVRERRGDGGRLVVKVEDEAPADTPEAAASRRRQALLGVAIALVVVVLAPLLGPRLPLGSAREPVDPRELAEQSPVDRDGISPLVQVGSLLAQEEPEELFTVRPDGLPAYWRIATLEDFDGSLWTSDALVEPTGAEVEPLEDLDVPTEELTQEVDITSLPGPWLPAAERPAAITGTGERLLADPASGTLVVAEGEVDGLDYTVVSERPLIASGAQATARPWAGEGADELTELPEAVGEDAQQRRTALVAEAQRAVEGAERPFGQAVAIQEHLRNGPTAVRAAPPGHGYGSVHSLLFGDGGAPTSGSVEQFASAFAVMARAVGLPTRVAVGFLPGTVDDDGTFHVTSADAWAWPEVRFEGLGWVPFEPTRPPTADEAAALEEQLRQQEAIDARVDELTGGTADGRMSGAGGEGDTARTVLYVAGGVLVLLVVGLVAFLVTVSVLRRRRRRRRGVGTPAQRVVGAYREALDELNEAGLRGTRAMTATELAAHTEATFGKEASRQLRPLGEMANVALFGQRPLDPRQADEAWAHLTRLESTLVAGQRPADRLRRRVDPRLLSRRT